MTTELLLPTGTEAWSLVKETLATAADDLLAGEIENFSVTVPATGQRIDGHLLADGGVRLSAAGNDTLVGGNRLTVRDERAVIAVGFSVSSPGWGTFYWDWTAPVASAAVANGIVRTMRDIYKADATDVELVVTL